MHETRISGIKKGKNDEKELMRRGRGACEELTSISDGTEITYIRWYDTKIVHQVSSCAKAHPLVNVSRYDKKLSQRIEIPCPDIIRQ